MSVACSSATLSEPLKAKKKEEAEKESEPRVNVSCISQNCFRLHADSTKQREENHLIESRTKNLIIMAIISSDLHFSSFAHASFGFCVQFSILVVPRLFPEAVPSLRFTSSLILYSFFCAFSTSTENGTERERTRVVAAMLCLCQRTALSEFVRRCCRWCYLRSLCVLVSFIFFYCIDP